MTTQQFIDSCGYQNAAFSVAFNKKMEEEQEDYRMYLTGDESGAPSFTGTQAATAFLEFNNDQRAYVIPLSGIGGKVPC